MACNIPKHPGRIQGWGIHQFVSSNGFASRGSTGQRSVLFKKGLSEAINKYTIREFSARVGIPLAEAISDEMAALYNTANRPLRIRFAHKKRKEGLTVSDIALLLYSFPTTIRKYLAISEDEIQKDRAISRERRHQLALQQKQQEVDRARRLARDGYLIGQIAAMMHHTYKTIQNYHVSEVL